MEHSCSWRLNLLGRNPLKGEDMKELLVTLCVKKGQTPKAPDQIMLDIDGVCYFASCTSEPDDRAEWAGGEAKPPVWARRMVRHALVGFYEG
jgi:hypothetical protein